MSRGNEIEPTFHYLMVDRVGGLARHEEVDALAEQAPDHAAFYRGILERLKACSKQAATVR